MIGWLLEPLQRLTYTSRRWPVAATQHYNLIRLESGMLASYEAAVSPNTRAPKARLSAIILGVAGCEFASSRILLSAGEGRYPCDSGIPHPETARRAALLLQEVSYCLAEGDGYLGVRCRELEKIPVAEVLQILARVAATVDDTEDWYDDLGAAYDLLWHAVVPYVGSAAADVLRPLMEAHGRSPLECACVDHERELSAFERNWNT